MATFEQALALAIQHHRAGRLGEAKNLYRRLIDANPNIAMPIHLLGQAERHSGQPQAAAALFRQALRTDPAQGDVWRMLAEALSAIGDHGGGYAALERGLAMDPADRATIHLLGSRLCTYGGGERLPDAIRLLERTIRLNPADAEPHHDLAVALARAERLDEALAQEEAALARRPDFAAAHMTRGNFLNESGARQKALASQNIAAALSPAAPELYYNIGNTQHSIGALEQSLTAYQRAFRLGLPVAGLRCAIVLIQMGRLAEAEAELRRAPSLRGADVASSIDQLADLFGMQGRYEEGRAVLAGLDVSPAADGVNYRGECVIGAANLLLREGRALEAAQTLSRVNGDSSRLFTLKSVAVFQVVLNAMGAKLLRPPPFAPEQPRICSSTLATHGRFAHNVLEYILIRLYAEKYGYGLETPEWVGGYYFDINHPPPSRPLNPLYFPRRIINGLLTGQLKQPPISDCDILSPLFLLEHLEEYRERVQSWLRPRRIWTPFIAPPLEWLRAQGDTVVAIHIRRGDFITCKYPLTETAWYVDWLRSIWGTLQRPVLYLASDDLDGVRADFAEFNPIVRADVADPWPGLEYLQDFHILSNADVVGVSAASGFSLLAARLNTVARLFVEPDMANRRIRPFAPWTSPARP